MQTDLRSDANRKPTHTICYLLLVTLALALRLAPAGRYVTPDEPAWVHRSIALAGALATRNWAEIPVTGHPGVTTMWLGALGVTVQRALSPVESVAHLGWIRHIAWLAPENGEAFRHLAPFLPWGRFFVALATTLGLVILYPLLKRLFGHQAALLTAGLLAFDPFLIGHSGLLHTDALLATFSLLALAAALNGAKGPRPAIWWMLSGLFTGLALLTKVPAIVLLPFIGLIQIIAQITNRKSLVLHTVSFILHCSLFISVIVIVCFALYPAFWVDPTGTFRTLFGSAEQHVETAQHPIFFAGKVSYDPGPAFYPAILLFRTSPIVLAGLALGTITLRHMSTDRRLAFLLLLAFAAGYGVLMSQAAKMYDRYLLPALLPLTLTAGLGIGTSVDWYAGKPVRFRRPTNYQSTNLPIYQSLISQSPIILQALIALAFVLYPLTYANPLVGGPWVAVRVIELDWGEGMGAAARWLNRQPGADQLTVAASVPTFASVFAGHTVSLDHATLADYIVLDPNLPTDQLTSQLIEQPAHTIKLGLINHAVIYTNTSPLKQAEFLAAHAAPGDLILLDANTPLPRGYTGPGDLISAADMPTQAAIAERLANEADGRSRIWLVADPAAAPITAARLRQGIEAIAAPVSTVTIGTTSVTQYTCRQAPIADRPSWTADFGDQTMGTRIALIDALVPGKPTNAPLPIYLRWQAPTSTSVGLVASIYLRDAVGRLWAEVGQPILNGVTFPTSAWSPGEWADTVLTIKPPERIPPGIYGVQLTLTDETGAQLGARDATGTFLGVRVAVGSVEIAPPAKPVGPAACVHPQKTIAAGELVACLPERLPQAVSSGDQFSVAITWSAAAAPQDDYRIRWWLVDAAGVTALEQVAPLSPYPTSHWRANDSFESRYDLHINPTLPAADYTLALNVLRSDGSPLWTEDGLVDTIQVLPRDRSFELPDDIPYPLDLALGTVVHLRGFDISKAQGHPGEALQLTLYWQGDGPTDIDYTVFVHLVGPDGQSHGQVDRYPGAGAAPTTSWAPGQVVVDKMALPVAADAPAGLYHVAVGMYDAASGGRLPITDAQGNRLPNDQAILPVEITIGGSP